jgi:hypothetical protein
MKGIEMSKTHFSTPAGVVYSPSEEQALKAARERRAQLPRTPIAPQLPTREQVEAENRRTWMRHQYY